MHVCNVSFLIEEEDDMKNFEAPFRSTPVKTKSQVTLEAVDRIIENTIPLLGFKKPAEVPVNKSVRALWNCSEEAIILRSLGAGKTSRPACDFYEVERTRVEAAVTTFSPTTETIIRKLDPAAAVFMPQDSECTRRHDSASPDIPTTSPIHNNKGPCSPPLDVSTTSTTQGKGQTSPSAPPTDHTSSTSQVHNRGEGRQALGRALLSVRSRYPGEFRQGIHETLKRGESVKKMFRILSLVEEGDRVVPQYSGCLPATRHNGGGSRYKCCRNNGVCR